MKRVINKNKSLDLSIEKHSGQTTFFLYPAPTTLSSLNILES